MPVAAEPDSTAATWLPVERLHVRLMHGFEFRVHGGVVALPTNVQRVVAFLAVRDRPQSRSAIAAALWSDTTGERAAANLRTALWKARQLVGAGLAYEGACVGLAPAVDVDLRRVVGQVRRLFAADRVLADDDTDLSALGGDLLPDWDEEWLTYERERLRQLRIHALEVLCGRLSGLGRRGEAIEAGLAAVAAEPLRESAHRALIAAHLEAGNVSEARRQFRAYRHLLWTELEVEPSPALHALVGSDPAGPPVAHQPRSRHSARDGRSAPRVESLPWPG